MTMITSMGEYNALSIKILFAEDAEERMPWLKAETLSTKYKRPLIFIQRGLEVYELAGSTMHAFVDRYLGKLPGAPRNEEAEAISRDLIRRCIFFLYEVRTSTNTHRHHRTRKFYIKFLCDRRWTIIFIDCA